VKARTPYLKHDSVLAGSVYVSGMGIASVLIPDDLTIAAKSSAESLPMLERRTLTCGLFFNRNLFFGKNILDINISFRLLINRRLLSYLSSRISVNFDLYPSIMSRMLQCAYLHRHRPCANPTRELKRLGTHYPF